MSLPGSYQSPRTTEISGEVKFQRQRLISSDNEQKYSPCGRYNALTLLSHRSTIPVQQLIGSFFYRTGLKAGFRGSPTIVEFISY